MTNVIVDAGTDAKIAKFQKRGIELIDLALLEPVEVWGEGGKEKDARRESMRIVADEMGASVFVNTDGRRGSVGMPSAKALTTFLQPGGSRPATPSSASSATYLHSQIALANGNANNSTIQAPTAQRLSSQATGSHQQYYSTPPRSNITPVAAAPISISDSNSNSSSSNNPTPVPPASPAPTTSMSSAMMSPPASPAGGTASGKRNLFNKLFNKKQNNSNLLSPTGSGAPDSFGQQQHPLARSQPQTTFSSLALSPRPPGADSFGSRSNSTKRRSAPPPALLELPSFSPSASDFGFASPAPGVGGISDLTSPNEQRTPTQMSIAGEMKTIITVTSPTSSTGEREKGHGRNMSLASITSPFKASLKSRLSSVVLVGGGGGGGSQSDSQAHDTGLNVGDSPTTANKKRRDDRDTSPHPSLGSRSRLSTLSTNDSAESYGGNGSFSAGGNGGGNGQAQAQSDITMNLRQQQLQLRPPVLGIQPTFVSSNPSSSSASSNPNASNLFTPDAHTTTTMENPDQVFRGQRALMYVWLVRRWLKKRLSGHGTLSGLGDSAVGFLGGLKEKGKEKEKGKDKDKQRRDSEDYRDKTRMGFSHDGLGAVTAPLMYGGVEVRFEWKRTKVGKEKSGSRKKTRSGRGRTRTTGEAESDGEVETSIRDRTRESERERERADRDERGSIRGSFERPMMAVKTKERLKSEEKRRYRMSTGSISSITTNSEVDGSEMKKKSSTGPNHLYDDGGDSDPEDSETPWVCTLKLRRGATPAAGDAQPQPPILQTQVLRIKVGTLSPTPHHPKVVAMLKVPFPLPDVEVERMGVVKRRGINIGGGGPPQNPDANLDPPYNGLVLTAEEIKDAVCSTGLWLVVREGFGGVGRVSRKGDGWRIRA